jgi:hypothetical protein
MGDGSFLFPNMRYSNPAFHKAKVHKGWKEILFCLNSGLVDDQIGIIVGEKVLFFIPFGRSGPRN